MRQGFTLIELLIYISVLSIVSVIIAGALLWVVQLQSYVGSQNDITSSASRAMRSITQEIREADGIYGPSSVFDEHPGQLSLVTSKYTAEGHETGYMDLFVCDGQVCMKKEGEDPVSITSQDVLVQELTFNRIGESVRITLDMLHEGSDISTSVTGAASVRHPQ